MKKIMDYEYLNVKYIIQETANFLVITGPFGSLRIAKDYKIEAENMIKALDEFTGDNWK